MCKLTRVIPSKRERKRKRERESEREERWVVKVFEIGLRV
jgi:hypothetical protein